MIESLKTHLSDLTRDQRVELADACGCSVGHLSNVAGSSAITCAPLLARHLQRETHDAVMPWQCRPDDWSEIWPELIGTKGAPKVKRRAARVKARRA